MYIVGRIIGFHGLKGYLKAKLEPDLLPIFKTKAEFYVNGVLLILISIQQQKNFFLLKFENIDNLNQAEQFKACDIYSDDKTFLKQNNFYSYDFLIDKSVYDEQDHFIGQVKFLRKVPQGYLLEIKKQCGNFCLVPFVSYFIKDVTVNKIIIKIIEGLL